MGEQAQRNVALGGPQAMAQHLCAAGRDAEGDRFKLDESMQADALLLGRGTLYPPGPTVGNLGVSWRP